MRSLKGLVREQVQQASCDLDEWGQRHRPGRSLGRSWTVLEREQGWPRGCALGESGLQHLWALTWVHS